MQIDVTAKHDPEKALNVFKLDPNFEENEAEWKKLAEQWLGEGGSDGEGGDGSGSDESGSSSEEEEAEAPQADKPTQVRLLALCCAHACGACIA